MNAIVISFLDTLKKLKPSVIKGYRRLQA